jgi:hypothetical protein
MKALHTPKLGTSLRVSGLKLKSTEARHKTGVPFKNKTYNSVMTSQDLNNKNKQLDVNKVEADTPGLLGIYEGFVRRFKTLGFTLMLLPLSVICIFAMSLSATPAVIFFKWVMSHVTHWPDFFQAFALAASLIIGYFIYGVCLCFVMPAINFLLPLKLKPWRGIWFSIQAIPWYYHNALTYMVRYTFLEMVTPSPLNVLFYRMMGMKIGQGVVINTTHISDPCLIELGDYVTIGGSAHLLAHYGQKGILILQKVKVGPYSTIGLKASVMGGVTIGERCMIKPHAVVIPRTVVADGESFG